MGCKTLCARVDSGCASRKCLKCRRCLKLLNLMPPDGSPWLFAILLTDAFITITLVITGLIIISSMLADVVEDAAVKTGVRSEGRAAGTRRSLRAKQMRPARRYRSAG